MSNFCSFLYVGLGCSFLSASSIIRNKNGEWMSNLHNPINSSFYNYIMLLRQRIVFSGSEIISLVSYCSLMPKIKRKTSKCSLVHLVVLLQLAFWPSIVMKKWLNIKPKVHEFSEDEVDTETESEDDVFQHAPSTICRDMLLRISPVQDRGTYPSPDFKPQGHQKKLLTRNIEGGIR